MDSNLSLITRRRAELEQEIARLRDDINAREREMVEIDTAGRVLARLLNLDWPPVDEEEEAATATKPDNIPTMPEMIRMVLGSAASSGVPALEPKDITAVIASQFWPSVKGDAVSSICWRLWKRGELEKNGQFYSLPGKGKAADSQSVGDKSAAVNPAQGREAGPGGGT